MEYIADLVQASRGCGSFRYGASPRGSLGLMRAAQGSAALAGRHYVIPDDVKRLALPVLSHRVILNDEERLRGTKPGSLLQDIIDSVGGTRQPDTAFPMTWVPDAYISSLFTAGPVKFVLGLLLVLALYHWEPVLSAFCLALLVLMVACRYWASLRRPM